MEHELEFRKSGVKAMSDGTRTVLEVADATEGVSIDSLCRGGTCGTCKVKLISGEVESDATKALSFLERRRGFILACSAFARSRLVIDA